MNDTTTVAPELQAPVTPQSTAPGVTAPAFDDNMSPSQVDALLATITSEQSDRILAGEDPAVVLGAAPAATTPPPEEKKVEAPEVKDPASEEKKESESEAEVTEEVLGSAHPALQKVYSDYVTALEENESLKEQLSTAPKVKYPDDPVMKFRAEQLETGNVEIPVVVNIAQELGINVDSVLDPEALFKAYSEAPDVETGDKIVRDALIAARDLVKRFEREGNARLVLNNSAAKDHWIQEGEQRATLRTQIMEFTKSIPEAKASPEPVFIQTDKGFAPNPKNPASKFIEWLATAEQDGLVTENQIKKLGVEVAYTLWKSSLNGHTQHLGEIRSNGHKQALEKARQLRDNFLAKRTAPTLGPVGNQPQVTGQFHGFDLSWLTATPENALQAQAVWERQGNAKAIDELMDLLSKK